MAVLSRVQNLITPENRLEGLMGKEWYELLKGEFDKDYMKQVSKFVRERRAKGVVYPDADDVFNAYRLTPYSRVRVVIVGQDPYINEGEAHGLAFSTYTGKYTPSLRQIEAAVEDSVYKGLNLHWNNDLTRWANQGVFLLNSVLTVDKGNSASHANVGWEKFTSHTLKLLSERVDGVCFVSWGSYAKNITPLKSEDNLSGRWIQAEHPVASSYRGEKWKHNDTFNRVNKFLTDKGEQPIIW